MKGYVRLVLIVLIVIFYSCDSDNNGPVGPSDNNKCNLCDNIIFVQIPGGTFSMGENSMFTSSPVHTVTVSSFEMSAYEITNEQYAEFLNDAHVTKDIFLDTTGPDDQRVMAKTGPFIGQNYIYLSDKPDSLNHCWIEYKNNFFTVAQGKEQWPVAWVNWYGAKAFALYYGFDLPTEAEWEYAAKGGLQLAFGTDDGTISPEKANYNLGHPVEVGSYPPNPFGLYDMCGNVMEWCHDEFGYYSEESAINPSGPAVPSKLDNRIFRGGFFGAGENGCHNAYRWEYKPAYGDLSHGFRVVRCQDGKIH